MDRKLMDSIDTDKYPECKKLGMVLGIAGKVARRLSQRGKRLPGMEFDDLVQIGYIALQAGHKAFNPEKGSYEHFVGKYIKSAMWLAVERNRSVVRLPELLIWQVRRLEKGLPILRGNGKNDERLKSAKAAQKIVRAVCREIDDGLNLIGIGLDEKWIDAEWIDFGLSALNERESAVVRLHYGLNGNDPLSFNAIASSGVVGLRDAGHLCEINKSSLGKMKTAMNIAF